MRLFLRVMTILASLVAQAPASAAERAASIEIRADGFAVIADEVTKQLSAEPKSLQIAYLRKRERGTTVDLVGINATYNIGRVAIVPTDAGLALSVQIRDFYLTIGRIDVHRAFPASCYGTSIRFGHRRPAPVELLVRPSVTGNQELDLELRSASTHFGADYEASGPAQCRGRLFSRPLIRSIIAGSLDQSRHDFERSLIDRLKPEIAVLKEKMNERIRDSMEFNLRRLDVIPDQDIRVRAYPTSLAVTGDSLRLELGIDVTRFSDFDWKENDVVATATLGRFGLSAAAVSEILGVLLADGSRPLHATPERFPQLAEILHVDIWQEIWPDLGRSDLSRTVMYPVVKMPTPPRVATDDAGETVETQVDAVELTLRVEQDGEWQDYFLLTADLDIRFIPSIENGKFRLLVAPGSSLVFSGEWADGNIARDRTARLDELNAFMADLLEAHSREPLLERLIPHVPFQGRMLTMGGLTFASPYLLIDWSETIHED